MSEMDFSTKIEFLKPGERLDETGFADIKIIQKPEEFCYGVDAVILAAFAAGELKGRTSQFKNTDAELICDLGSGTGIIPLILSHKTGAKQIYGIEFQEASYDRALRNAKLNGVENRFIPLNADVSKLIESGVLQDKAGTFDAVTSNPPYVEKGNGLKNDVSAKMLARHESTAGLYDFMEAASYLLKDKGDFFLVHRPARLVDIFECGRKLRLEPKEVLMVSPCAHEAANIVLVHFAKNGGKELKMLPELHVYRDEQKKEYSEDILRIYERIEP